MQPPHITLAQANRYVLKRQHLLQPCTDPIQAVIDACSLQAQVPSAPALALRARVKGFARADYDDLLVRTRTLVRTWALRGTMHVVPSAQLPMYTQIYAGDDVLYPGDKLLGDPIHQTLEMLKTGPLTRNQLIEKAVAQLGVDRATAERHYGPWGGILRRMALRSITVHVPVEGADVPVAPTVEWLGYQPESKPLAELEDDLFMTYAHGYGPVSVRDFAYYTLFTQARAKAIIERCRPQLAEVHLEGSKLLHYLPAADMPDLLSTTGAEPAPVQLLPRFDSLLLAYKDKVRILDEVYRTRIFRPAAVVEATLLLHGRVAGTWRMKNTSRMLRLTVSPFGRIARRPVMTEAARLAKWLGLTDMEVTFE